MKTEVKSKGGVAGHVWEQRQNAKQTIQKVMEEYGSARKHVAKQIVAVCTKLPGPPNTMRKS